MLRLVVEHRRLQTDELTDRRAMLDEEHQVAGDIHRHRGHEQRHGGHSEPAGGIGPSSQTKVVEGQGNIRCELLNLYLDGNTAIAEWEAEFDDRAQYWASEPVGPNSSRASSRDGGTR
jgi:hypothetical protein